SQEQTLIQFILDERRLEKEFRNNPRAIDYLRSQGRIAQVTLAKILKQEYPQLLAGFPLNVIVDIIRGNSLNNINITIKSLVKQIRDNKKAINSAIADKNQLNGVLTQDNQTLSQVTQNKADATTAISNLTSQIHDSAFA